MRFKAGDKVKVTNPHSGAFFFEGDIVTIHEVGTGYRECYIVISPYDYHPWILYGDEISSITNGDWIRSMANEELAIRLPDIIERLCEDGMPSREYMEWWLNKEFRTKEEEE